MVRTKPQSHIDYLAPFARSLSKPVLSACKAVERGRSSLGAGRRTVLRQAQHERDRVSFVASWLFANQNLYAPGTPSICACASRRPAAPGLAVIPSCSACAAFALSPREIGRARGGESVCLYREITVAGVA